ncbi:AsmA family protein [Jannaschia marina]|uniref:AsmA family protein n=1 Tax=Jannaschia marina TaxID=2741674 RepID=UPI0015C97B0A|nr:AsmA family protein [Jannaschia marina]
MRNSIRQWPMPSGRWGVAALAALSLCAASLFLFTQLDLEDDIRDSVNAELARLSGNGLTLDQRSSIAMRPSLRVDIPEPIFSAPGDGEAAPALTAQRIEAALRIAPSAPGGLEVARLYLHRPQITVADDGLPLLGWSEMRGKAADDQGDAPAQVVLTEGTVDFVGESRLSDLNLTVERQAASDAVSLDGDFVSDGRRAFFDFRVDDPERLFTETGSAGRLAVRFDMPVFEDDSDPSGATADDGLLPDLRQIVGSFGLFATGPLVIEGQFSVTPRAIKLSNATFTKGGYTFDGHLDLNTTTEMPILPTLQTLQVSADSAISDMAREIGASEWSAVPITTEWLEGIDMSLALEGEDLALGGAVLETATLSMASHDGGLTLDIAAESRTLGKVEARTALDRTGVVEVSARASDISVDGLMHPISRRMRKHAIGTPQLPEGTLDAELDLAGQGRTLGELSQTIAGSITASVQDGSLTGADVTATLETLANGRQFMTQEKGPLIPAAGRTRFERISGLVGIEEGIARISTLSIAGDRLEIDMLGEVGLKNGILSVVGNAQLFAAREAEQDQVARHVDLPFGIGGTLFAPMIAAGVPQIEAALTDTAPSAIAPTDTTGR